MPGNIVKVKYDDRMVDAELVHVDQINEHQNTYILSDGTVMSMRTVVVNVLRLINRWNADGQPIYLVQSNNTMQVNAPEKLLEGSGDGDT